MKMALVRKHGRCRAALALGRRFFHGDGGAVTMEYVLLCTLIAAASVMMVVTFSRAVVRRVALVSYAMAGHDPEKLSEAQQRFRDDLKDDVVVGQVYSDNIHGERVNKD